MRISSYRCAKADADAAISGPPTGAAAAALDTGVQKRKTRMNKLLASLMLGPLLVASAAAVPPRKATAPAPAASAPSAASAVSPRVNPAANPALSSPAVRASEEAQLPGEVRPENRVVPLVVVPLRGASKDEVRDPRAASAVPGRIDDSAARRAAGGRS
jgi:hypothetical protein